MHLSNLRSIILPRLCLLCQGLSKRPIDLCIDCENELPWLHHSCYRCGLPVADSSAQYCGNCLNTYLPFTRTVSLFAYQFPIDGWISALKFQQKLVIAELFGVLASRWIAKQYQHDQLPQCLLPVPLHPKRTRERGFNQALLLAKPLAQRLSLPLPHYACRRVRNTQAQSNLAATARQRNMKNCFMIANEFNLKHVAIIDDVVTTGHTVREFTNALRDHGVQRVDVWCIARTAKR